MNPLEVQMARVLREKKQEVITHLLGKLAKRNNDLE